LTFQLPTLPLLLVKKTLCYIILFSMVLHCASRLGVLSHIYQYRHHIAQAIGLVVEIPIAVCNSDYYADQLVFQSDEQHDAIPAFVVAMEINLFIQVSGVAIDTPGILLVRHQTQVRYFFSSPPCFSIFHPPSLS
jgi:hypothetical protein